MKHHADHRRSKPIELKEGQMVYLRTKNLKLADRVRNLTLSKQVPSRSSKKIGSVAYRLQLPLSWKIHPISHILLLFSAIINEQLHPDIIDEEEEYKIETVLDCRGGKRKNRCWYLVKWKAYPDTTWESRLNLMRHTAESVSQYESAITS